MADGPVRIRGREDVLRTLDRIDRDLVGNGQLIEWGGRRIRDLVIDRTRQGRDVADKRFDQYSKRYASKKGRESPVDLAGTAKRRGVIGPVIMMNLLEARKLSNTSGQLEIRPGGSPDRRVIGEAHHRGKGNVPVRKWMGLSPSDRRKLDEETIELMEREIRGAVAGDSGMKITGRATQGRIVWNVRNPD